MKKKRSAKAVVVPVKASRAQWSKLAVGALESMQANVFLANRDLKIVFVNEYAKETLRKMSDDVRRAFGVEVNEILGSSIHRFHKDPEHVERILRTTVLCLTRPCFVSAT